MIDRRAFLALTSAGLLTAADASSTALPIKRAVEYNMLPAAMPVEDRLQLAADCGFEEVEFPTTSDDAEAERMKRAAAKARLRIHSVMNMDHWKYPLSSADPEVVERSLQGARTSLRNAHLWGADTVLLVPGVVDAKNPYAEVYRRSREAIGKLLPMAEELRVVLAIEEVWNKFLLSPLEFAKYVDDFQSPWLKAYFDVGNVVLYGYPQDWIRVLGKRIAKLHIKDFSFRNMVAKWEPLLQGDIQWGAVHDALREIGYAGTATVELPGGDAAYLRDVNQRFERILRGAV